MNSKHISVLALGSNVTVIMPMLSARNGCVIYLLKTILWGSYTSILSKIFIP